MTSAEMNTAEYIVRYLLGEAGDDFPGFVKSALASEPKWIEMYHQFKRDYERDYAELGYRAWQKLIPWSQYVCAELELQLQQVIAGNQNIDDALVYLWSQIDSPTMFVSDEEAENILKVWEAVARDKMQVQESEDMSSYADAAIGPMLQSWTSKHPMYPDAYFWRCPTTINGKQANFELTIQPFDDLGDAEPEQTAVSMRCQFNMGDTLPIGHWFGFTYDTEEARQHILISIYRATSVMKPKLSEPVVWKDKNKALMDPAATSVPHMFKFMQDTIGRSVMTPEAKALGITYYTGSPKRGANMIQFPS